MTEWIKSIVSSFSYPGIVFLMCLENVFPPIPSELIMPLAGYVSTEGKLSFIGVCVAGTVGSVLGAIVLYYIGRKAGEKRLESWVERRGHWIGLSPEDLEKSRSWFDKHGGATVLFCRLIPGIRSLISIPAGVARMPFLSFLLLTTLGSAVWTVALAYAGRTLGQRYDQVEHVIGPVSTGIVVLLIAVLIFRAVKKQRERSARAT